MRARIRRLKSGAARLRRAILAVSLAIAIPAALPAQAPAEEDPGSQPPFGGERPPELVEPRSNATPPTGFEISARKAIGIAAASDVAEEELAETPGARPTALIRGERWQVSYREPGGEEVAQVIVDGRSGEVVEAWRDHQVETKLARGYEDAVAQEVNAPWVWLSLCLLFVAPFVDPRRPLRIVHLDLLVLVGLGVSLYFFNRAEIGASVALTYPVLGYFLLRMLVAGLWPRERAGPLVPYAPIRWLAVGAFVLIAARLALNVIDSQVIDIGVAGVIGADRIADGVPLYEGTFSPGIDLRGDVYGPANYLAYLPFEQRFGWEGVWNGVAAAHAAAIAFDLVCVGVLVALGRRLRTGEQGRALGWALGFAWAACPWTLYTMNANANDALVAALGAAALLALASPPTRGALLALAAAAKFGSAALAPLFATATGERRWRSAVVFALAFAAVAIACLIPFLPDGGLREFYDRTLGYQATRGSPFSVWGLAPSLDFAQPVVRVAVAGLAVAVALYPRFKTPVQVAALAAAVTIAIQLTATHWFYFYVVWFLPFVLVASFAELREVNRSGSSARRAGAS
jgi:hypothetical protein